MRLEKASLFHFRCLREKGEKQVQGQNQKILGFSGVLKPLGWLLSKIKFTVEIQDSHGRNVYLKTKTVKKVFFGKDKVKFNKINDLIKKKFKKKKSSSALRIEEKAAIKDDLKHNTLLKRKVKFEEGDALADTKGFEIKKGEKVSYRQGLLENKLRKRFKKLLKDEAKGVDCKKRRKKIKKELKKQGLDLKKIKRPKDIVLSRRLIKKPKGPMLKFKAKKLVRKRLQARFEEEKGTKKYNKILERLGFDPEKITHADQIDLSKLAKTDEGRKVIREVANEITWTSSDLNPKKRLLKRKEINYSEADARERAKLQVIFREPLLAKKLKALKGDPKLKEAYIKRVEYLNKKYTELLKTPTKRNKSFSKAYKKEMGKILKKLSALKSDSPAESS